MKVTPVLASTRPITPFQLEQPGSARDMVAPIQRMPSMAAMIPPAMARPSGRLSRFASSQEMMAGFSIASMEWRQASPQSSRALAAALLLLEELEEADLGARQPFAATRPLHAVQRIAR